MTADVSGHLIRPSAVLAAREYIRRFGGLEPIDPEMLATANLPLDEVQAEWLKQPVNEWMIQVA